MAYSYVPPTYNIVEFQIGYLSSFFIKNDDTMFIQLSIKYVLKTFCWVFEGININMNIYGN